jgi:CRP-like cAMP-binding protein
MNPMQVVPNGSLKLSLKEHPFARSLKPRHLETLLACAQQRTIDAGEYIWRQGEQADSLLLISSGHVSLEIGIPLQGSLQIDMVGPNEILGWSWLIPDYRWQFDARALTRVNAIAFSGQYLRDQCEDDPVFGYRLLKTLTPIIAQRLQATRVRLLELSGPEKR